MKILFFSILLVICCIAVAQPDTTANSNTHYFSIQGNQLLRQLLNFGGSSQNVNNPFLLNYSFNGKKLGFGMNFGGGLNLDHFRSGDEFNEQETKSRQFFFRFGLDKKFDLSDRWLMGWGIDVTRGDLRNNTINTFETGTGTTNEVETTNSTKSWGFGPRLTLAFRLNDKFLIGTEANYYFTHSNIRSVIIQSNQEEEEEDETIRNLHLSLPSVIYLLFTF